VPSTHSKGRRALGDDGFVTVEAAIVFTAITAVIGLVVAGVMALATYLGAVSLARDAARAVALGNGADAQKVVAKSNPDAEATVSAVSAVSGPGVDDGDSNGDMDLVRVTVVVPGALFDISASAVIVHEPD
jgi:Flp pilus assembly protein TadG